MNRTMITWFLAAVITGYVSLCAGSGFTYQDISLLGENTISETEAYRMYKEEQFNKLPEVHYLIGLVKESPYLFERDERVYSSGIAARYLNFKFKKARNHIRTPEEFIDTYASYVEDTGEPFYIIDESGTKFVAKDVLYKELKRLRAHERYVSRQARAFK